MLLNDRVLALLVAALGALLFAMTLDFPDFPGQRYGPALFPRILATGFVLSAAFMFWRTLGAPRRPWLTIAPIMRDPYRVASFLAVPAAVLFYLLTVDRLGFAPTAFIVLAALMLWLRVRLLTAVIVSVCATAAVQWFFASLMRVPLPRGLFMQILFGG